MAQGQICAQEVAKASNNVLNEFANFNKVFVWNIVDGAGNATVINNVGGRESYFGLGAVSIDFTGTSPITFDAGGSSMQRVIQKTGNYILSYAFNKSDETSDINFTVNLYVNSVLSASTTISQNLYFSSGFTDNQWNVYFQNVALEYGDVIDFSFTAQSDTTDCFLYFDRLKLELDDRGNGNPTIYTEAPLDIIEEENTLTIPEIAHNETYIVTASLTGCKLSDDYIAMRYPSELNDLGLVVGYPSVYADNVVKFAIHNERGSAVTPTEDGIYNFKVIR
jgi:hypothetical protein